MQDHSYPNQIPKFSNNAGIDMFIDKMPGPISVLDEDLNYLYCNSILLELLGMKPSEIINHKIGTHNPESEFTKIVIQFKASDLRQKLVKFSDYFNGTQIHFLSYLKKEIIDGKMQIIVFSFDTSEMVLEEKKEEKRKIELVESEKMMALGEIAVGVSHEVNNPLAIISGRVSVLKREIENGIKDQKKSLKNIDCIIDSCNRIKRVTDALKNIGKNSHDGELVDFHLGDVIDDLLALFSHRLFFEGVELRVNSNYPDIKVYCSFAELAQIFLHIIKNSIDATKSLTEKWVNLDFVENGDHLDILIMDSGPGIPPDIRKNIFDPFYTTKGSQLGSGVGLSAAKELLIKQGGDLFYNENSKNTCFVIRLQIIKSPLDSYGSIG